MSVIGKKNFETVVRYGLLRRRTSSSCGGLWPSTKALKKKSKKARKKLNPEKKEKKNQQNFF